MKYKTNYTLDELVTELGRMIDVKFLRGESRTVRKLQRYEETLFYMAAKIKGEGTPIKNAVDGLCILLRNSDRPVCEYTLPIIAVRNMAVKCAAEEVYSGSNDIQYPFKKSVNAIEYIVAEKLACSLDEDTRRMIASDYVMEFGVSEDRECSEAEASWFLIDVENVVKKMSTKESFETISEEEYNRRKFPSKFFENI